VKAAIVVATNLVTIVVCVPIYLMMDNWRQINRRGDLICCVKDNVAKDNVDIDEEGNLAQKYCVPRYASLMVTGPARVFSFAVMVSFVVSGALGIVNHTTLGLSFSDVAPAGWSIPFFYVHV